uniref:Secreted RxLR effector protein 123 n=1 Tax=Plasmopara viticola TaxID=143451 RepID=RL123_PLAVT|nr:RecName: Full=Secreted RxLR effector protein 123; Flags: Precursor [Plasmopara viticola]
MVGAYYVGIALLVAGGSQTAAGVDQYDLEQTPDNGFSRLLALDEMLRSRFLRKSRNPKDNLMLSEANEERTPSSPSNSLTEFIVSEPITTNVMRTE